MAVKNLDREPISPEPYDICIIGSGPAGLTLCAELADSGKHICVLESGQFSKSRFADGLRETVSDGEIIVRTSSRERIFGGTSTTWSGLSAPLDPIDFLKWPISLTDVEPYYIRAHRYGFSKYEQFKTSVIDPMRTEEDFSPKLARVQEKIFIASDPPWNFGKKMRYLFEKPNVDLLLDSTVIKLLEKENVVTEVHVRSSDGAQKKVLARLFVIAAGGIESTRLLLASGIGNQHGQVGKYLTNHPKGFFGIIRLTKKIRNLPHYFGFLHEGRSQYVGLRLSEDIQKSERLLNSYVRFEPMFPWTDNRGVEALIMFVKKTKRILNWWKQRQKKLLPLRDWNETGDHNNRYESMSVVKWLALIPVIFVHAPAVVSYSLHRLFPRREIAVKNIRIRNFIEMEPRGENRLILSNRRDAHGILVPEIYMSTSERDRKSLSRLHEILAEELEKNKIGRLDGNISKAAIWPISSDASHHLGGTIMGNDPRTSVVDKNLKVHSVDNLYVASGSVFPTSGCANPTYTICALSIRLAEFLKANP